MIYLLGCLPEALSVSRRLARPPPFGYPGMWLLPVCGFAISSCRLCFPHLPYPAPLRDGPCRVLCQTVRLLLCLLLKLLLLLQAPAVGEAHALGMAGEAG